MLEDVEPLSSRLRILLFGSILLYSFSSTDKSRRTLLAGRGRLLFANPGDQ
jgi:hypothetical protein